MSKIETFRGSDIWLSVTSIPDTYILEFKGGLAQARDLGDCTLRVPPSFRAMVRVIGNEATVSWSVQPSDEYLQEFTEKVKELTLREHHKSESNSLSKVDITLRALMVFSRRRRRQHKAPCVSAG